MIHTFNVQDMKKLYCKPLSRVIPILPMELLCQSDISFSKSTTSEAKITEMEVKQAWSSDVANDDWDTDW